MTTTDHLDGIDFWRAHHRREHKNLAMGVAVQGRILSDLGTKTTNQATRIEQLTLELMLRVPKNRSRDQRSGHGQGPGDGSPSERRGRFAG